jgi:Sec-independent protein secretion pathway component TatC
LNALFRYQTVFAAPMVGLYVLSILIVWLVQPKRSASTKNQGG